ncbi:hypothetical protein BDN70DRAFT_707202 [Pholiota conissans]|uniref:Uncharacterized protein n=1 Tax=Pholiota conissans TaxID=109636 RepID=A0A9P5ZBB1_9AGAR|nr:hypothetical protein BDN70DRAFT_707202 [Pholiota conissans]
MEGLLTPRVEYALFKILDERPSTPSIITSNFREIAIFLPPSQYRSEPVFERVSTTDPFRALRAITMAYLVDALPAYQYVNTPDGESPVEPDLIGPPHDPNAPLIPDEIMFATHHRHSDFDFITLVHDRARVLQFFRWKDYVREHTPKVIAHPNHVLRAVTNEIRIRIPPNAHPIYPYDASELPSETLEHLSTIQRASPLAVAGIDTAFEQSQAFTLAIDSVVSEGTKRGICTVYRCHITSIDNNPVSSPTSLCLKLFDDRLQSLHIPSENDTRWFTQVVSAQMYALNEAFVYEKLRPVQGSVVPWFYGMHQFTLPNGDILYGLLIEFLEGGDLRSEYAKKLSMDEKIQTIQSCRHAARVLDVADVRQSDWYTGQVLVHRIPQSKLAHAVLIDFASTTQTWDLDVPKLLDNYYGAFLVLLDWAYEAGFDGTLVWNHFGEPDEWDPITAAVYKRADDKKATNIVARTLFPFIIHSPPPPPPPSSLTRTLNPKFALE